MNQNQKNDWEQFLLSLPEIPWPVIVLGFWLGAVPGLAMLALRMMQESARKNTAANRFEQLRQERSTPPPVVYHDDRQEEDRQERSVPHSQTMEEVTQRMKKATESFSAELNRTSSTQRRRRSSSSKAKGIKKFPYKPIRTGKGLMVIGAIVAAIFSIGIVGEVADYGFKYLEDLLPLFMFWGAGVGTFLWGWFRGRTAKLYRKYLARMENQPLIPLREIAESLPASMDEVCQTIQRMIDDGIFGDRAYIDIGSEMLVIDASVAKPDPSLRQQTREVKQEPERDVLDFTEEDKILQQIRSANDRIPDEVISQKIDRIEEITRHILTYLHKHPERAGELHTFLDYYLPTTLKMLNTYAELDAQKTDGENIAATKRRIEGILDKVVEGFELQLDKLFEGDMLDIASDIDVMEQMLRRDGLSGDTKLRNRSFDSKAQQGYTPHLTLDPNGGAAAAAQPEEQ